MKVLHLIDTLSLGGAQTILKAVFDKQKDNPNIFLYALRTRDIHIEIDHPNIFVNDSTAKYSFAPLKEVKAFIEKHQIEVLHCHLFRSEVFGFWLKKRHFPNIKLIFHEHGQIVGSDNNSKIEDGVYVNFKKMSHSTADLLIAVSNAMRDHLIERAGTPDNKVKVLYNFVDLKRFDPDAMNACKGTYRDKYGIPEDAFVVGFAGRIIKRKGWKEFVETARILLDQPKNDKLYFLMAGNGQDKDALNDLLEKMQFGRKVHYVGYVKNMLEYYAALDCFMMPSHFEGLPMSQLEVMSLGIPLLTTDGPGMDEIPKDGIDAVYMTMKDPNDMAAKVKMLMSKPDLQKELRLNAQQTVQEHSLDNFIKNLDGIYSELYQTV